MSTIWRTALAGLGIAAVAFTGCAPTATATEFVVLGDMPYGEEQLQSLKFIGKKIRKRTPAVDFVIHYGDVKSGGSPCKKKLIREHLEAIFALRPGRVFLTPGDNDWTDCDRPAAGGYNELKQLDWLREEAFSDNVPNVADWQVTRQANYPENALWHWNDVQFATLHIVGTANGRDEILIADGDNADEHRRAALDAVDARDIANLAWLDEAFDRAAQKQALAVVIAMHADPFDLDDGWRGDAPCTSNQQTDCHPYLNFLQQLTARAAVFDRPVLLVHGSTDSYCLDRGFGGWQAPRLWRLNGPGDFVAIDATAVRFDAGSDLPFSFRAVLTGDRPPDCIYSR